MDDPLVRQAVIEELLNRAPTLTPEEFKKAANLGLTDPDFNINEITFNYLLTNQLAAKFKTEITSMAERFSQSSEPYYKKLGNSILATIQKAGQIKA
ncbi:hypothetical protein K1X76_04065 [bacterium]|nr:hypothetical protein [bacterium]